ncbi:MAG TPA: BCCT family transporter [Gammaproteobacteria bacterium]|nr:BCCT family transporter [Gammaproteobacteria bacterium]
MQRLFAYFKRHTNPPVFIVSGLIIVFFLAIGGFAPHLLMAVSGHAQSFITHELGWFYILAVSFFLVFILVLMCTRFGSVRLGPDDSVPAYGTLSWFAMLFTAGMGIGLVYYGVAEPLSHFKHPPTGIGGTPAAALHAMNWTFYDWGLHAWAIYIVLGLSMAYFTFRHKLPLRPASAFYPLIGERIYGPIGNLVDILAVFGTVYGLATSIGIGAHQIAAGLAVLFSVPNTTDTQVMIIAAIEVIAITSVMVGLDKGVRNLSLINLWLAVALMMAVAAAGPLLYLFNQFPNYVGYYLQHLLQTSLTSFGGGAGTHRAAEWQSNWTLFYWGWWISWSPFVGLFIARISYGRTVRQFIVGALLAPVGASFVWFTVFGGTALYKALHGATALMHATTSQAIFELINSLPFGHDFGVVISGLTVIVVTLFFATSSDSGSFVVDMLTNGGDPHPVRLQRLFWAVIEGLVAIVLLEAGGIKALQTAAIVTGLPFAFVLLVMCYALYRAARIEHPNTPDTIAGRPRKRKPRRHHRIEVRKRSKKQG